MNNFIINDKDIIEVYKLDGNLREYNHCLNYFKFKKLILSKNINQISNKLNLDYSTIYRWDKYIRIPYGIKTINFLKEKNLIPFKPDEKIARIVGFLHGDGYIFNSLTIFGFVSSDLNMLNKIKEDIDYIFKLKGEIEKFRNAGEEVIIKGKKTKATKPTYHLEYGPKAICHLLFLLGVPKGKKVNQNYQIPDWIKNGSLKTKKAFLQGLFDAELSKPRISSFGSHKQNVCSLRMELVKHIKYENSLKKYLLSIKNILSEFNINSCVKYTKRYDIDRVSYSLIITNNLKNIKRFIESIGFYYSNERKEQSNYVLNIINKKLGIQDGN